MFSGEVRVMSESNMAYFNFKEVEFITLKRQWTGIPFFSLQNNILLVIVLVTYLTIDILY